MSVRWCCVALPCCPTVKHFHLNKCQISKVSWNAWARQGKHTQTATQPKLGDMELNQFLLVSLWNPDIDTKHSDSAWVTDKGHASWLMLCGTCIAPGPGAPGQVPHCHMPLAATHGSPSTAVNCSWGWPVFRSHFTKKVHGGWDTDKSTVTPAPGVILHSPLRGGWYGACCLSHVHNHHGMKTWTHSQRSWLCICSLAQLQVRCFIPLSSFPEELGQLPFLRGAAELIQRHQQLLHNCSWDSPEQT